MKLSTINLIVQSIIDDAELGMRAQRKHIANEATIYLKAALICEMAGIDEAMKYLQGPHTAFEYQEWLTGVTLKDNGPMMVEKMPEIDDIFICDKCNCTTKLTIDGFCGKCRRYKKLHTNNLPKPHKNLNVAQH